MKKLGIWFAFVLLGTSMFACAQPKRKEKAAEKIAAIKKMIDSQRYVFAADYVTPLRGGTRLLTSDYDLKITKDSVIAFLPYFGRAYFADYNPTEGGITFSWTNFAYNVKQKKNGSWEITIKSKEVNLTNWRDVQQLTLNISINGYASLTVISSSRDPISFDGYIKETEVKMAKENAQVSKVSN